MVKTRKMAEITPQEEGKGDGVAAEPSQAQRKEEGASKCEDTTEGGKADGQVKQEPITASPTTEEEATAAEKPQLNSAGEPVCVNVYVAPLYEGDEEGPPKLDATRTLRMSGLPATLSEETDEAFSSIVAEILESTFGISARDHIDAIRRLPQLLKNNNDDQQPSAEAEEEVDAAVTFKSRIHKHRVYTQRHKMEAPMQLVQYEEMLPHGTAIIASTPAKAANQQEAVDETPNDDSGVGVGAEDVNATVSLSSGGGDGNLEEELVIRDEVGGDDDDDVVEEDDGVKQIQNARQEVDPELGELLTTKQDSVEKEHKEGQKGQHQPPVIDWEGAPEFQWKLVSKFEDRTKLVIDNCAYADIMQPFFYQVVQRANSIHFIANAENNNSNNSTLKRGRLELTFYSDAQTMSQAINSLVHVRTRGNKRLKVLLPETNATLKMRANLEKKLGRVIASNPQSCQLLVRQIGDDVTEDDVKNAFDTAAIQTVLFKQDILGRRCAVVTFSDAETAILKHMRQDEIKLGRRGNKPGWVRVFYMQDVDASTLMTRGEMRERSRTHRIEAKKQSSVKQQPPVVTNTDGQSEQKKSELTAKKKKGNKAAETAIVDETTAAVVVASKAAGGVANSRKRERSKSPTTVASQFKKRAIQSSPSVRAAGRGAASAGARGFPGARRAGFRGRFQRGAAAAYTPPYSARGTFPDKGFSTQRGRGASFRGRGGAASFVSRGAYSRNGGETMSSPSGRYGPGPSSSAPWQSQQGAVGMGPAVGSVALQLSQQQAQLQMQQRLLQQTDLIRELADELKRRDSSAMAAGRTPQMNMGTPNMASGYPSGGTRSSYGNTTPSTAQQGSYGRSSYDSQPASNYRYR